MVLLREVIFNLLRSVLRFVFCVKVRGLENLVKNDKNVLIVANHVSYLDAFLLKLFLPINARFAINVAVLNIWWVRPFVSYILPFSPGNIRENKLIISELREGGSVILFPEGRVSSTGSLMKISSAAAYIADAGGRKIVPVYIDGAVYSVFSKVRKAFNTRIFPKISISVLPARKLDLDVKCKGNERLRKARQSLYDIMTNMSFEARQRDCTLFEALIEAKDVYGSGHVVAEDIERKPLTYKKLLLGSLILGRKVADKTILQEKVGMMLPNVQGALVTFFAMQCFGRIPAILNFTSGVRSVLLACETAQINTIVTSRRFIEQAGLVDLVNGLEAAQYSLLYLEDVRLDISVLDKVLALIMLPKISAYYAKQIAGIGADDPAVMLFTSGSEGTPKGVVLSHKNILSNLYQLDSRMNFRPTDVVFNVLPMFHSSGLTGGTLIPVLNGMKVFFYPTPLHFQTIPELIYDSEATIFFATDTFLSNYAKYADSYDFYNLRYVLAGAEKLKPETISMWSEKFGIRILEGYGATETSPILAFNTMMHNKHGTVGRVMPGMQYKVEKVPGIMDGGRLLVKGDNVMLGYIKHDKPGRLVRPVRGWYDTGDIVTVDEDGYITIVGRVKRFAKVAGEMISLTAVESYISMLWPNDSHAVASINDNKKGEQLILITTVNKASKDEVGDHFRKIGVTELSLPKKIVVVDELPVLGSGKVDYVRVTQIANGEGA